ncbi:protein-tyrosine-phosphatase [bacterium]|nr:protein-tyrosine-phosphatase [bacterium]
MLLNPKLKTFVNSLGKPLEKDREVLAQKLADYIKNELKSNRIPKLNFICTHNSRRSHFAQIWAHTLATYFKLELQTFSGGVEVTAMNERVAESLQRTGFIVSAGPGENPRYNITYSEDHVPINCWSKEYSDPENPQSDFAAVMVCSAAETACPFIPNAGFRMALTFEDPKEFDDTEIEAKMYDQRSKEIANELFRVFQIVTNE